MRQIIIRPLVLCLAFIFCVVDHATLYALSKEQKDLFNSGVYYFDYATCEEGEKSSSGNPSLTSGENRKKALQYFIDRGWKDFQAAGIVGNLVVESGVEPQRLQSTPPGTQTPADSFSGGSGWGIAQWTPGTKFINPVKSSGKDPNDLQVQLEVIADGLEGKAPLAEKLAGDQLKTTNDYKQAAEAFQGSENGNPYFGYERPQSRTATIADRQAAAKIILDEFGGSTSGAASASISVGCECKVSASSGPSNGKVVVLDPGHSGSEVNETDPDSGVKAKDYDNGQETKDVWTVSENIKKDLEVKGYKVISTKKSASDSVGLIERARIANEAKADIAVSIHTTGGGPSLNWVTPQEVGRYRQTGSNKKTFDNEAVAKKSKAYSDIMVAERKKAEGDAQIHALDFSGRDLPATGNISIVQLFSNIPWIYNEAGQSSLNKDDYAKGITGGIVKALGNSESTSAGSTGGSDGCADGTTATSDFASTVKAYAHPDYRKAPFHERMPAWAKVADDPKSHFVGGSVAGVKGIDCGGFVTMTLRNSGLDTNYNPNKGNTNMSGGQRDYLRDNWKKLNVQTTKDLQPGDVAMSDSHTFLFVGKIDGFNDVFASSSWDPDGVAGRAPMAGQGDAMVPGKYEWFRKK